MKWEHYPHFLLQHANLAIKLGVVVPEEIKNTAPPMASLHLVLASITLANMELLYTEIYSTCENKKTGPINQLKRFFKKCFKRENEPDLKKQIEKLFEKYNEHIKKTFNKKNSNGIDKNLNDQNNNIDIISFIKNHKNDFRNIAEHITDYEKECEKNSASRS